MASIYARITDIGRSCSAWIAGHCSSGCGGASDFGGSLRGLACHNASCVADGGLRLSTGLANVGVIAAAERRSAGAGYARIAKSSVRFLWGIRQSRGLVGVLWGHQEGARWPAVRPQGAPAKERKCPPL